MELNFTTVYGTKHATSRESRDQLIIRRCVMLLGMQQYGQNPYCVLLFEILQYIAILQYSHHIG